MQKMDRGTRPLTLLSIQLQGVRGRFQTQVSLAKSIFNAAVSIHHEKQAENCTGRSVNP
jgi:hypothetical protein